MKSRLIITFGVAALAALSGCASAPSMHHTDRSHSQAWNITQAAGYTKLRDVDREDISQEIGDNGASLGGTLAAGGLGFLSNPNGLTLPSNVGVNMLTNLLLGANVPKANGSAIFVWIPKDKVDGPQEAMDQVYSRVKAAFLPAMKQMDMPAPYSWREFKEERRYNNPTNNAFYGEMAGGECDSGDYYCSVGMKTYTKEHVEDSIAPDTLGGKPAWHVRVSLWYSFIDHSKLSRPYYARLPVLHALNDISEALPPNYYLYVSPGDIPFEESEGEYRLFPAPVVFHQGETLYFIEPKQQS